MGGKSDNSPTEITTTATQEASIPSFLQPFLSQSTGVARGALSGLQDALGGNLVAGFNPDQTASFDALRGIASGDQLGGAIDALSSTARGDFLFGGDGFNQAVDAAVRAAQPGILSRFGAAGRGTGGLAQAAIGQSATDAFARMFGQERQRQLASAQALPGLLAFGPQLLSGIGQQQQDLAQQQIQAPITAQQLLLSNALGGLPLTSLIGRSGTSTRPLFQNQRAGQIGGALAGAGLGGQVGSLFGPIGTGIGAIGGGLLGALS